MTATATCEQPAQGIGRGSAETRKTVAGFTLVELLVVVAIISLLIALLLPALAKAKVVAQSVQCASNLHQISIAFFVYASDSGGLIPGPRSNDHADTPNWKNKLTPSNTQSPKLYTCPATTGVVDSFNTKPANYYGMNMYLLKIAGQPCNTGTYHDNWWKPKLLNQVVQPAVALLGAETMKSEQRGAPDIVVAGGFYLDHLADLVRHPNDSSNVLFCDGHVVLRVDEQVITPDEGTSLFWEGRNP